MKTRRAIPKGETAAAERKTRPRYTLGELIAQCHSAAPLQAEKGWVREKPVGRELI
jgi:hypothetical protein